MDDVSQQGDTRMDGGALDGALGALRPWTPHYEPPAPLWMILFCRPRSPLFVTIIIDHYC